MRDMQSTIVSGAQKGRTPCLECRTLRRSDLARPLRGLSPHPIVIDRNSQGPVFYAVESAPIFCDKLPAFEDVLYFAMAPREAVTRAATCKPSPCCVRIWMLSETRGRLRGRTKSSPGLVRDRGMPPIFPRSANQKANPKANPTPEELEL